MNIQIFGTKKFNDTKKPKRVGLIVIFAIIPVFIVILMIPVLAKKYDPCFPGSVSYFFLTDVENMTGRELQTKDIEFNGCFASLIFVFDALFPIIKLSALNLSLLNIF